MKSGQPHHQHPPREGGGRGRAARPFGRAPFFKRALGASALGLTPLAVHQGPVVVPHVAPGGKSVERVAAGDFIFRHDRVLGTSLELIVRTGLPGVAQECRMRVLGEIERLRGILSTYDAASEIREFMAGRVAAGPELSALLNLYETWAARTGGAVSAHLGAVLDVWRAAAQSGRWPEAAVLRAAAVAERWTLNVDALGKGFILDRAVAVARSVAPEGLLNIGGDLRVWGASAWRIGVADPRAPAENAPALAAFTLREAAVATSGGYQRFFTVGGERLSHVLDPRTLRPTGHLTSATMVAGDAVTANALATAGCVLGPDAGADQARRFSADYLMVDDTGNLRHSAVFVLTALADPAPGGAANGATPAAGPSAPATSNATAVVAVGNGTASPATDAKPADAAPGPWPQDFQVYFYLSLKTDLHGAKHPYVAVWIENAQGKVVRDLNLWGTDTRYLPELSSWWTAVGNLTVQTDPRLLRSITRSTRSDSEYAVIWDGLDDKRQPVPMGDYKIWVEITRENGGHVRQAVLLPCGQEAATVKIPETTESLASEVKYVKKITFKL